MGSLLPNSSLVSMPHICASMCGVNFPRETQANICSPGQGTNGRQLHQSCKTQLSKPGACLERTGKGYLQERGDSTPNSYSTTKSHPIMNDDLLEVTLWSLLSVNLPFPVYPSISQDHLQLGWAVEKTPSGRLESQVMVLCHLSLLPPMRYHRPGCHCLVLFDEFILPYG